jgi:hypothetical protein
MTASATPERLGRLEQRVSDHEARCEERLAEIKAAAANTLKAVEGLRNRSWGLAIALLAWACAQLWTTNQARLDRLERAALPSAAQALHDRLAASFLVGRGDDRVQPVFPQP